MIELQDIRYHYPSGDFRLDIPHLAAARGEKLAVIGPSGSGKTTLLNLVAGILLPVEGTVSVNDTRISTLSDAKRRDYRITTIGFVFQDFGLIDYLDVLDNIIHPYRITKALRVNSEIKDKARWYAEQMGLGARLDHHPANLSHGERQRVAICRALLPDPKIILADEATGNLDPANKQHIQELLFTAADSQGTTLLSVTHDRELLSAFDRVVDFREFLQGAVS